MAAGGRERGRSPAVVTVEAFAARLGVSPRRVRQLVALGMPARRGGAGNAYAIPVDEAAAWHAAHVGGGGDRSSHGGKRPGAGRKKSAARMGAVAQRASAAGVGRGTEAPAPAPVPGAGALPGAGAAGVPRGQVSRVDADIMHKVAQARLADLRFRRQRGDLWNAKDVESTLARLWRHAAEALGALPAALAAEVCSECGYPAEDGPRVEVVVRRRIGEVLELLRDVDLKGAA